MLPKGKGVFVWQGKTCGPVEAVVERAVEMGLSWVAPRLAWTIYPETSASYPEAEMRRLSSLLHAKGIGVYLWHYINGGVRVNKAGQVFTGYEDPKLEGQIAGDACLKFDADGIILDPETEYKFPLVTSGSTAPGFRALRYGSSLRAKIGQTLPVGLCSYRYPSVHREFPWKEFLSFTDFHCPQVYWGPYPDAPARESARSKRELLALKALPYIPAGRIFIGAGHAQPQPAEVTQFMQYTQSQRDPGVIFWSLDNALTQPRGLALLEAIKGYSWGSPPLEQPKTVEARLERLEDGAVRAGWFPG